MKELSEKELYERQIKIEHIKLSIKSNIFCTLSALFAVSGAFFPVVTMILAVVAGDDTKMKVICILASILYLAATLGLSLLFIIFSIRNDDDFIPIKLENGIFIRKYRSEILAEKKIKKRNEV